MIPCFWVTDSSPKSDSKFIEFTTNDFKSIQKNLKNSGDNIRLIYDTLQFTEENDIPGLLLLIDFEKAFDSISWDFLLSVLKFFNIGVKVFYNNISSAVIQGGNLSELFSSVNCSIS
jgi:hypothetical protein